MKEESQMKINLPECSFKFCYSPEEQESNENLFQELNIFVGGQDE